MNEAMQIIREVNEQAELFYEQTQELGKLAAETIKKRHRAQMTSLENIAETTLKSSDVYDYIKKQMARPHFEGWRKMYMGKSLGESLLKQLEILKGTRNIICDRLRIGKETDEHKRKRLQIFLLLIRQFIRQVVVRYEYETSLMGQRERSVRGADRRTTAKGALAE